MTYIKCNNSINHSQTTSTTQHHAIPHFNNTHHTMPQYTTPETTSITQYSTQQTLSLTPHLSVPYYTQSQYIKYQYTSSPSLRSHKTALNSQIITPHISLYL